ncbi:MAG: hypothetical protein IKU02_05445, partial [Bacteroidaceae bacterium]|nr:hypothetical protein [Bacteroidaceae bacterium]
IKSLVIKDEMNAPKFLYIIIILLYGISYFFSASWRGLNDLMTNDLMTWRKCKVLIIKPLVISHRKPSFRATGHRFPTPRSVNFHSSLGSFVRILYSISGQRG